MRRPACVAAALCALTTPAPGRAGLPATGLAGSRNMQWLANAPNLAGNALDLFERRLPGGEVRRYAIAATYGNGFDIVDFTDPSAPVTTSRYVTPGVNYHPWVQVNPVRNIAAVSIEDPGLSPAHGLSNGIEFVDITDVTAPVRLGVVSGLGGPHTIRMIGDRHVYTTLPTFIVDYSDPRHPVNLGQSSICGHEFVEDHNVPGRTYAGLCGNFRWGILDTSDPADPQLVSELRDLDVQFAHEVFPAPDSSFVGVADFRGGMTQTQCPGGGIHFYDISGKYVPGASFTNPRKMGTWFAPFGGVAVDPNSDRPNWASCTTHSWQMPPERLLVTAGVYTAGSWVMDPTEATRDLQGGGLYDEWDGRPGRGLGPTTWGNTTGNFLAEGDFVNASQWLPFDSTDPAGERYVFTNGLLRGTDILRYDGPLPKKAARLRVDAAAAGGVVSGVLDRFAVLTPEGWVNRPLAGEALTVSSGAASTTAVTGADGSFAADLGLAAGGHQVTAVWAGNDAYRSETTTRVVQA